MILIDHRSSFLRGSENDFARSACDRREGIGADGVILLEKDPALDCFIRFFNPDGGEYGLCGNGARCVPAFARELGLGSEILRFRTLSGTHEGQVLGESRGRVSLTPVSEVRLGIAVDVDGAPASMDWGNIGVPHAVMWVNDVEEVPISRWGPHLRHHAAFGPEGSNVSFAQVVRRGLVRIRTFERGVEGETWACGSGSATCATILAARGEADRDVDFLVRSGATLRIRLPEGGSGLAPSLEGPVHRVFEGTFAFSAPPPSRESPTSVKACRENL